MALSLYDAVGGYPWATWTSLREAWEVAEHYRMTYSKNLKVYAALLIDTEASDAARGHLALGAKQPTISTSTMANQVISPHSCGGTMDGLHGATRLKLPSRKQLPQTPEDLLLILLGKTFYHMADHGA